MELRSLKVRSALVITAIFALVGALTLAAFLMAARAIVETFGRRFAEQHAVLDKNRILGPIQREVALAQKLADSAQLRAWLRAEDDPSARAAALAELDSFRRLFRDGSVFFVHDTSRHYYFNNAADEFRGRELRYVLDPADPTMAWYAAAMREIETFALHVDSSEQLGLLKVWINVVVRDGGRKVGLAGTGMDLTDFVKRVVQGRERGVAAILVDASGTIQAHPDPQIVEFNARTKDEAQRIRIFQRLDREGDRTRLAETLARLARAPEAAETFYLQVDGRRQLVAATSLPDLGWFELVLVDPSQVLGLRAFLPILILLVGSLLATIFLVSVLLNRIVLKPLAALTASTREIAAGNYGVVLPEARPDEIGQLTSAFGHMATTVQTYTTRLEDKVRERTEALSAANQQLAESTRQILDSLEVAHRLQTSLLPDPAALKAHLPEHMVLYRPRDQVGGDFYAIFPAPPGFLLALGDCTGHGVPGALMTMSARAVLEQLLAELGPEHPARLLQALNRAMRGVLRQEAGGAEADPDNGLDLALLRVMPDERRLRFASARIPLLVHHEDGTWEDVAGDRESLGYRRSNPAHAFQQTDLRARRGDTFFLSSDGLLDQAGGPRGFGLGRAGLRTLLEERLALPMAYQKEALVRALQAFQGDRPQRDDITLLGFRLD